MFYSRSNRPKTIPHPECSKEINTYELEIDKDGKKELVQKGKTNIYEKIQAQLEETLIYNILNKYQNGDQEIINKLTAMDGMYGDYTNTPKTLAEAQQTVIDAHNQFNDLPLELRKEFNYSATEFLASLSNGGFDKVMSKYVKVEKEETPTTEVKKEEIKGVTNE